MSIIDTVSKQYLRSKRVFADIFNYVLYDGKQVIKAEQLLPVSEGLTMLDDRFKEAKEIKRDRDIRMNLTAMEDPKTVYLLLGIESQANVDYTMPVRSALYDMLEYVRQIQEIKREHAKKQEKGRRGGEFLQGFYREDRITPIVTVVVFFGSEEWDGPTSLHEMFDTEEEEILSHTVYYKMNLISPSQMTDEEIDKFESSMQEVSRYIKCSKDKEALAKLVREDERYRELEVEAAMLLNVVTNSNLKIKEGEEKIDMCKAIEDMRAESLEEGLEKGREKTLRQMAHKLLDLGMSISDIAKLVEEDEIKVENWVASYN